MISAYSAFVIFHIHAKNDTKNPPPKLKVCQKTKATWKKNLKLLCKTIATQTSEGKKTPDTWFGMYAYVMTYERYIMMYQVKGVINDHSWNITSSTKNNIPDITPDTKQTQSNAAAWHRRSNGWTTSKYITFYINS